MLSCGGRGGQGRGLSVNTSGGPEDDRAEWDWARLRLELLAPADGEMVRYGRVIIAYRVGLRSPAFPSLSLSSIFLPCPSLTSPLKSAPGTVSTAGLTTDRRGVPDCSH